MYSHQGQIDASLYPTEHALDIVLVGVLIAGTEESACIVSPPGNACCLHAKACGDLPTEGLPVVAHIAAPHGRAVTLDARKAAAGEDHGLATCLQQSFVDGLVDEQRIDVAYLFA